jgi:flavorubredoxin
MTPVKVCDRTWWIGTNDYETHLFEGLWPLPRGISYNSYLIVDDKVAMIDAVKHGFAAGEIRKIQTVAGGRAIDTLVVNHMEPDHSGAIPLLRAIYPKLTLVGNRKTAEMLAAFYGITENVQVIADGDELRLGAHALKFFLTPMVHWPETMMTYDSATKVLFSGDAFGGFGALADGIFDDQVDRDYYAVEVLRYFTNIVAKYSPMVHKAIARLTGLDIAIVAPTHGPIWRANPQEIIARYDRWSRRETQPGATVVFGSMYGNTERMAEAVAGGLVEGGIEAIRVHNVSRAQPSFILNDIWQWQGVALGSPTYNTKLFPLMDDFLRLVANLQIPARPVAIFGTYGWSKGAVAALEEFARGCKWNLIEPIVEAHCSATDAELDSCHQLGMNLAKAIQTKGS